MTKDKKTLYALSLIILAVFSVALFVDMGSSKIAAAILLLPITPTVCLLIKKRSALSINKKEVLLLSIIIASIYATLTQASGVFFGFYKNPYFVSQQILIKMILPLALIIIGSEIIRCVLLAQKNTAVSIIAFLICVILEILMFSSIPDIRSFNKFMDLIGLTLFPAISANIYFHYVSKRFGAIPNIFFRLITTLYTYFIPTVSAMSDAIFSMIKLILPIIMLAFISAMYEKKKKNALNKGGKLSTVGTIFATVVIILIAMLISCQFRFGAIVIATESMTGEINKGDMIIYEEYKDQKIEEGQVIVFLQNNSRIIHRVVSIETVGGETRYYTKGDANPDNDLGYRTEADIIGLTDVKIAYAGYPTLWLREILKNNH